MAKEGTKKKSKFTTNKVGVLQISIYKILTNLNKTLLILNSQFTNFEILKYFATITEWNFDKLLHLL